jgi:hypothetical protein
MLLLFWTIVSNFHLLDKKFLLMIVLASNACLCQYLPEEEEFLSKISQHHQSNHQGKLFKSFEYF